MKKDLNIMERSGKRIFEVGRFGENMSFTESPSEFKQLGENESEPMVSVSLSHLRELTAIDENVGRTGYFHFCGDEDERNAEPITVIEYDINKRPVRLPC